MRHTLEIQNLKCGGCANTIITKLNAMNEISDVSVNVETSEVSFNFNSKENLELVETKLIKLGYPPLGVNNSLTTKAKSFVSCAVGKTL